MNTIKALWCSAGLGAIALAGCSNNNGGIVPIPPASTAPATTRFSFFTESILGQSATSTPVPVNDITFDFDVNDDPSAFNYALM